MDILHTEKLCSDGENNVIQDDDDDVEEFEETDLAMSTDIVKILTHMMDNNIDQRIRKTTVIGLCKIILHDEHCTPNTVSKLLLAYFNPATDAEIKQSLGNFFESIIKTRKQEILCDSLIPTLVTLPETPQDCSFCEIEADVVLKYVISASRPTIRSNRLNLHDKVGLQLIRLMKDNSENKDILKLISKELQTIEISEESLKSEIAAQLETLCLQNQLIQK
ncbi:CLUMA_CG013499, isoform A [Clunio marinus]|uniref:CLUMA_CG013499, isoform A n=1 Tax=Clunio marinus TaxID=568069 RepID=A0A1J1IP14_9DIPT|nr:CLUMA_CG013499, isoform A [Clunio marinus]